jgi:thymidylate synthase (FAD)
MFTNYECELIDSMGSDLTVVNAARVSFSAHKKPNQGKYTVSSEFNSKDEKLIGYLADNWHTSPFEHCTITFRIKCPLFIARQIMRHRTFSYNEISRRYTSKDIEFWMPEQIRLQSEHNLQCSAGVLHKEKSTEVLETYKQFIEDAYALYEQLIEVGIAREQARAVLPQSMHTSFYMTGNLLNWVKFINLRDHKDAQPEVRIIAKSIVKKLIRLYPVSMSAFDIEWPSE